MSDLGGDVFCEIVILGGGGRSNSAPPQKIQLRQLAPVLSASLASGERRFQIAEIKLKRKDE